MLLPSAQGRFCFNSNSNAAGFGECMFVCVLAYRFTLAIAIVCLCSQLRWEFPHVATYCAHTLRASSRELQHQRQLQLRFPSYMRRTATVKQRCNKSERWKLKDERWLKISRNACGKMVGRLVGMRQGLCSIKLAPGHFWYKMRHKFNAGAFDCGGGTFLSVVLLCFCFSCQQLSLLCAMQHLTTTPPVQVQFTSVPPPLGKRSRTIGYSAAICDSCMPPMLHTHTHTYNVQRLYREIENFSMSEWLLCHVFCCSAVVCRKGARPSANLCLCRLCGRQRNWIYCTRWTAVAQTHTHTSKQISK